MVKWIVVMKIQPSICLDDWGKPRKKPSQVGRHRDSNPGPPECESRALPRSHLARLLKSCCHIYRMTSFESLFESLPNPFFYQCPGRSGYRPTRAV